MLASVYEIYIHKHETGTKIMDKAAIDKPLKLTEIFIEEVDVDSWTWKETLKTAGKWVAYPVLAVGFLALVVASGGVAPSTGGGWDDSPSKNKKPDTKKIVKPQSLKLQASDVVLAERLSPKSEFAKVGARTKIFDADGIEHYITQPVEFLEKMGCDI